MEHSVGVEHCCFSLVLSLLPKGRNSVFRLFRQMGSLLRGRLFGVCFTLKKPIQIPCTFMQNGDNIPRPVRIYLVMNEKVGMSV
jgi:hypothetical protein